MRLLRLPLLLLAAAALATLAPAASLSVFAAASLSDALKEIAPIYAKASGDTLRFNLGASGALALQIRAGAPADVIFSADELRLDQLEKGGFLLPGTRRTLLANTLVIVVPGDSAIAAPADLAKPSIRRVVLGDPAIVPAGTYAREYLAKLGLWDVLRPKTIFVDNVRAVLAAVESGDVDAGIVYKTDALISSKVEVVFEIPASEGPAITYPAAVVKGTRFPGPSEKFVAWLAGPEAQAIFSKYGFIRPAR